MAMARIALIAVVGMLLSLPSAHAQDAKAAAPFKAGFAEADITPEIGMEMPGGYGKAYHRTLHDPCKVRAAVFDDGTNRVAIVGIDALSIHRDTVVKVRKLIADKTGLAPGAILIGASHSHSSGPMFGVRPGEYDHASPLVKKLAYETATAVNPKYLARVEEAIVDAVCRAHDQREAARAGVGKGIEDKVAFNRRFRMAGGGAISHPGLGNPDIVEPAGPVDPEVGVIGAWDAKDPKSSRLIGCVVNFACHATTSPGGISANYIFYLEKVIQGFYGKDCVVVFLAGASGDVTQVDNRSPYSNPDGERWAKLVGGRVGAEALKVLLTVEPGMLTPIATKSTVLKIERRPPSQERVKKSLDIVNDGKIKVGDAEWTFAREILMLDALMQKEPAVDVEVQALQVGPAVFVTNPAEYFCQYGLDIKAKSKFPFTFPVSLANGGVGYVPTEEAFGPRGGGYETRLTSYSNLKISAGRLMRDAGIALAAQLTPGTVPERPRHPPYKGSPWAYGNVRPELE
jgi:neutral ceramidase